MPYAIGIQNVVVKDDTDEITVGMFHKVEEDEFTRDIEGKKVQISGEYSTFQKNGTLYKNISKGKILIEGGNEKQETEALLPLKTTEISDAELKIRLLKLAINFAKEFDDKNQITTKSIIEYAELFDTKYVRPEKPKAKPDIVKQAVDKAETLRKQKDSELTDEKAVLIGDITRLIEEKNGQDMIDRILEGQKANNLEELDINRLKAIYNSLDKMSNEVPF
jgi:hypothetical protein